MDRYDLLVIGGGRRVDALKTAAKADARVALVDIGPLGGTASTGAESQRRP